MAKTVIGVFAARQEAEKAINDLRSQGFDKEISLLAKEQSKAYEGTDRNSVMFGSGDSLADGTTTGGVLGGIAGLALGAGALAIPGIGPIIAAGPIAALLSGAAAGGLAGGLADWGIPEERGKYYEGKVKEGRIVTAVQTSDDRVKAAADILRKNGAQDVESH